MSLPRFASEARVESPQLYNEYMEADAKSPMATIQYSAFADEVAAQTTYMHRATSSWKAVHAWQLSGKKTIEVLLRMLLDSRKIPL